MPTVDSSCTKHQVVARNRAASHGTQPWGTHVKGVKANYIIFRSVFCSESLYCLAFTAFTAFMGPLAMGGPMAGDPRPDQRRC